MNIITIGSLWGKPYNAKPPINTCTGLSLADAKRLNYYLHFRPPTLKDEENIVTNSNVRKSDNLSHFKKRYYWGFVFVPADHYPVHRVPREY